MLFETRFSAVSIPELLKCIPIQFSALIKLQIVRRALLRSATAWARV